MSGPADTGPADTGPAAFVRDDARLGRFSLHPVVPEADAPLLHRWLTHPKAEFWTMRACSVSDIRRHLAEVAARPGGAASLGRHRGSPQFLVERYDPRVELAEVYPAEDGDVGMHLLVAPSERPISGFTRAAITTVMEWLFADPTIRRVVVEPDVRNEPVHALNAYVGFRVLATVPLPGKRALLSVCSREDFRTSRGAAR